MSADEHHYEILAVRYGTVRSTKSDLFHRFGAYREPDARQDMDFFFYVLRRGAEVILVDTGFRPESAPPRGRECLVAPAEALAVLGIDPRRVALLIVTHCHWDHIGNVALFDSAELLVPERELEFWADPLARNIQFWAHTEPDAVAHVLEAQRQGRVVATGANQQLVPGIRAITVGGHSAGQQILVVETAGGPVILASDAAHLYEELELERPFAVAVDFREMVAAYALIKRLGAAPGAVVVPGHDPLIVERFPALNGDAGAFALQVA